MRLRRFLYIGMCVFLSQVYSAQAVFVDGANAVDLIGQYMENDGVTVDYSGSNANDSPGLYGLGQPGYQQAFDLINHRFFVVDSLNHRVLVFNLNPSNQLIDKTPDYVLGQPTLYKDTATTTQSGLNTPRSVAFDSVNQRLFVADYVNDRVLVYDVSTITNVENAIYVLGQTNFISDIATSTQSGMFGPVGLAYDSANQRLFVSQTSHCITVYNVATSTIANGMNAINVLGQSTFTGNTSAMTQSRLNTPIALEYDGASKLFVADSVNSRVIVYDVAAITNGENAINVLGQSSFVTATSTPTQNQLHVPYGISYDTVGKRLFVSDRTDNRVVVYDVNAITNGENAVNVLGQSNFTNSTATTTQTGLARPQAVTYESSNNLLYVSEFDNNRIVAYDVNSIVDGEAAVDLIGHYMENDGITPDYTKSSVNSSPGLYGLSSGVVYSNALDTLNHRLFSAENGNGRILVFNLDSSNRLIDKTPDYVLGQSTFFYTSSARTQASIGNVTGLAIDVSGQRLFVSQGTGNRITVFDIASITNGENAISVLGQADFSASGAALTQSGLSRSQGLTYDATNQRLFVADYLNNRVLVYDVASITDGENAINVLGQANFTSSVSTSTQSGMSTPYGLAYDDERRLLFVTNSNHRVLVYDVASITDGENAINVLGQSTFTGNTSATTRSGMNSPRALAYDSVNKRLFVSDTNNQRVLVYDVSSINDGENAINVIGQSDFTSAVSLFTQSNMVTPGAIVLDVVNQLAYVRNTSRMSIFSVASIGGELSTSTSSSTDESTANNFVTLLVTGTSTGTSTVQLDITGGTATAVTDYSSSDPITITIPPGIYDGTASTSIAITLPTLVQDSLVETGGETITFSLINPNNVIIEDSNADTVIQSSYTYTITDDDVASVVSTTTSNTVTAIIGPIGGSAPVSVPVIRNSATTKASPQVFTRTLKLNSKGVDVKDLQKFLNSQGFSVAKKGPGSKGKETTLFGPATKAAVIKFQKAYRVTPANGVVGEKTRGKVEEVVK